MSDNLTTIDVDDNLDPKKPQKFSQLMQDVNDVFVANRKKLDSFPPEYQERLRNTYRFFGIRYFSDENFIPKMSGETFDVV